MILTNFAFWCGFERLFLFVKTLFSMPLSQKSLLFCYYYILTKSCAQTHDSICSQKTSACDVWMYLPAKKWINNLVVNKLRWSQWPASLLLLNHEHSLVYPKLYSKSHVIGQISSIRTEHGSSLKQRSVYVRICRKCNTMVACNSSDQI
jgi:hypothetical protein